MNPAQVLDTSQLAYVIQPGFLDSMSVDHSALYGDTDSSYSLTRTPFNKYDDPDKVIEFIINMSKYFNSVFQKAFTETVGAFGGVDPEYNMMYFKPEVIAVRGFFNGKKVYSLAQIWNEGKRFDELKIKKTGGQIKKSDSTIIVSELLNEIYRALLLDTSITDEKILYKTIFIDINKKYKDAVLTAVNTLDFKSFGIPKKWSMSALKSVPAPAMGCMLWNLIFDDRFRPGDSFFMCQIKINQAKIYGLFNNSRAGTGTGAGGQKRNRFCLTRELIQKVNVISIPVNITEDEFKNLIEIFRELDIEFDIDKIMDFNLNKKLDQFTKIFSKDTIRNIVR